MSKKLATKRLGKVKRKKDLQNAVKTMNKIEGEEETGAVALMKDSLDERIHRRIKPYLQLAGTEIESQVFR